MWRKPAGASEPANYTFAFSNGVIVGVIGIASFDRHDAGTPINVFDSAEISKTIGTPNLAPDITTTSDLTLLVASCYNFDGVLAPVPSGMINLLTKSANSSGSKMQIRVAREDFPTAGATGTRQFGTNTTSSPNVCAHAAIKPA